MVPRNYTSVFFRQPTMRTMDLAVCGFFSINKLRPLLFITWKRNQKYQTSFMRSNFEVLSPFPRERQGYKIETIGTLVISFVLAWVATLIENMSSLFAQFSGKLSAALKSQGKSIGSFVIVILTATLNHVLTKDFFKCPRQNYKLYGWCFLIGPALMLAMMTLLLSFATSQFLAGICKHDEDAPERACFGKRKRTWKFIFTQICLASAQSLIAFFCWVVLTLLSTETYSCIKIGPKPNSLAGNKVALYNYISLKERFDSFSKILGLFLLVTCLAVAMLVYFVMTCCYTDFPDKMLPSMRRYDKLEAEAANETFTAHMTRVAKLKGKLEVHRALKIENCSLGCIEDDNDEIFEGPMLEEINDVRKFLARRYPRLENEANKAVPYRDEKVIWVETFDVDETDGKAPTATAATKTAATATATAYKDAATQPDLVNCLAQPTVSEEGQQPNSNHVAQSFVEDRRIASVHQYLEMEIKENRSRSETVEIHER